jgi:predicted nucleic acid-binding protein
VESHDIREGAHQVEDLTAGDYRRIRELCVRYADLDIGFVDAAVMAVVERLDEPKLATLDHRHFSLVRPFHRESIALLPD